MNSEIKFTIVIPTRERVDTLVHTLRSALAQDYDNFEVLVSDNASTDRTEDLVLSLKDPRIHYLNTGKRMSMSHNWEFALEHVTDGWVTILGDDDAILPGALQSVSRMVQESGTQAVRSNGCAFSWPELLATPYGRLTVSLKKGWRRVCSRSALQRVLDGELDYTHLPVLYNGGFVDTALIRKARSMTGNFFRSMTPDVYSAMVFSLLTDEYVYSDEPLAINGASHHSGGTAGFEKINRKRSYDPAEKFYSEDNIAFHQSLPLLDNGKPVRSIHAIVCEAYLQAEPFHDCKNLQLSLDRQLELILSSKAPNRDEIRGWGEKFATQHKLNYDAILARSVSFKQKLFGFTKMIKTKSKNLIFGFTVPGNENTPMSNVYEASLVAGSVKTFNPGMYQRVVNLVARINRYVCSRACKIFSLRGRHA